MFRIWQYISYFCSCWTVLTKQRLMGWEQIQSWDTTQAVELTHKDQSTKGIQYHATLCSAIKNLGEQGRCLPRLLLIRDWQDISGLEVSTCFCTTYFSWFCFVPLLLRKWSLSKPMTFLIFAFLILSPVPLWANWVMPCWPPVLINEFQFRTDLGCF